MDFEQFDTLYLQKLNPQQREAVLSLDGKILLLATPGSGKTTVLVTRLGYMICCKGIDLRSPHRDLDPCGDAGHEAALCPALRRGSRRVS